MKKIALIPAYNEEQRIADIINNIRTADSEMDIVVINDGSQDRTNMRALEARAIVLNLPVNLGYGSAVQTGYKYAREYAYDIIVQMDADGQHDPRYIPAMIKKLDESGADIVIGSRFLEKTAYKTPLIRRIGMIFFSIAVKWTTGTKITDPTSGYQVIKKELLPILTSEVFPYDYPDADFLILLYYAGFKTVEFPMEMTQGDSKKSMHAGIFANLYYVFKMCLSIILTVIREKAAKTG